MGGVLITGISLVSATLVAAGVWETILCPDRFPYVSRIGFTVIEFSMNWMYLYSIWYSCIVFEILV